MSSESHSEVQCRTLSRPGVKWNPAKCRYKYYHPRERSGNHRFKSVSDPKSSGTL